MKSSLKQPFLMGALSFAATLASAYSLFDRSEKEIPLIQEHSDSQSPLEKEVQRLNTISPGYALTEQDLVKLARTVYFEDKFDPAFHNHEEQFKGFAAVAEVIENRFLYDTCSPASAVKNPTCGREKIRFHYDGNKGIVGVINQKNTIKDTDVYQFSSLSPRFFGSFFTDASLRQGFYDTTFLQKEKDQMDLAYQALVGVLDGSIAPLTEGALSYKNTDVTHALQGAFVAWHDQKVFNDTQLDCDALTQMPSKMDSAQDVRCRVEREFKHDRTVKIGLHDFYTIVEDPDARKEIVWADGCKYVNGAYVPKGSASFCVP